MLSPCGKCGEKFRVRGLANHRKYCKGAGICIPPPDFQAKTGGSDANRKSATNNECLDPPNGHSDIGQHLSAEPGYQTPVSCGIRPESEDETAVSNENEGTSDMEETNETGVHMQQQEQNILPAEPGYQTAVSCGIRPEFEDETAVSNENEGTSDLEETNETSAYMLQRERNILRNKHMMQSLGLVKAASSIRAEVAKRPPKRQRRGTSKTDRSSSTQTLRRSNRNVASAAAASGLEEQRQHTNQEVDPDPVMPGAFGGAVSQQHLLALPEFTRACGVDSNAKYDAFKYHDLTPASKSEDKLSEVPEQNVAFARLATKLNLSAMQSDEILGFIKAYGGHDLPKSYRQGICRPIKKLDLPMDTFEFTRHIPLSQGGVACPGYNEAATLPLRFSDPLWLAQELLMSPKVMENPALVHFKSVQEHNTQGTRCYSELYTGNWCVLHGRVCFPCFAFASNRTLCSSVYPVSRAQTPVLYLKTPVSPAQTPVLYLKTPVSPVEMPVLYLNAPVSPIQTPVSPCPNARC